jgi:hypothetical protein
MLVTITACSPARLVTADADARGSRQAVPAADQPPRAFLAVAAGTLKISRVTAFADWIARFPVQTLQLRSIRHGRLIRSLLRSLGNIEATSASDGMVIAAVDFGCRSQLLRIDPATGKRTLIREVPESVQNMALSPDGRRLAYLTNLPSQRQPCQRMRQPRHPVKEVINPGGPIQLPPAAMMLTIINLASGATVRVRIRHAADPTWSPDGTEIAVTNTWAHLTRVLSASTLASLAMHKFVPLCQFAYAGSAWTRSGLAVAMQCNIEHGPNRPFVELVPLTGRARPARLELPRCTSGVGLSYAAENALIWAGLGYGGQRPCGFPEAGGYAVAVMLLHGASFGTVATIRRQPADFTIAGW